MAAKEIYKPRYREIGVEKVDIDTRITGRTKNLLTEWAAGHSLGVVIDRMVAREERRRMRKAGCLPNAGVSEIAL